MSCTQARYINVCESPEVTENVINRSTGRQQNTTMIEKDQNS